MPPTEVNDEENAEDVVEVTAAGVESLPLRTTWSRLGPARSFFDPEIERLYRAFNSTVRRADVQYPFVSALICTLTFLIRECTQLQRPAALSAAVVLATLALVLLVLVHLQLFGRTHWWKLLPLASWCVLISSVLMYVLFTTDPLPSTGIEWYMLTVIMVYVCLPVRLPYSALLSLVTVILYIALAVHLTSHSIHFRYRIAAGVVLLVGATALGATACLFHDLRQRRAYQETRKVMEVKASIEEQSKTRERLLMSVLPRHVAETMRQDWGRMDVGQFKKVYMNRHENVSILFADIVGFTAISSTYSAAGLVHVLNELFASFDRLAEQYHQLRIKILGDCYYCISGCPVERDDHAILSVQMGLSMVTAIKSVRESTNSTVDMRVGIHTGAVLAGVMGQKQWQFDVYSKDVELANKMESSGKPGRVHVSNKTLERLDNVFEVEPAYAEKRETNLRRAGLTTYFIVKPLQEVRASLGLQENGSDAANTGRPSVNEYVDDPGNPAKDEDGSDYRGRLEPEITLSRQQLRDLMPHVKWFTLTFRDPEMEQGYRANREPTFGLSLICLPIALAFSSISQGIVTPSTRYTIISLVAGMIVLLIMAVFMIPIRLIKRFPRCMTSLGVMVQSSNSRTIGWIMIMNIVLLVCNLLDMMMCPLNSPFATRPLPHSYHNISECPVPQGPLDPHTLCIYPAHFSYLCVLILCTYPLQVEVSHLLKLPLALAAAALHCWANLGYLAGLIDCASAVIYDHQGVMSERVELCVALLVTVLVVLILNFHAEVSSRIAFLWKREMTQQKAEAADLQQKNESLVENLLPPHVTQHFLHRDFRLQHEELYAQSFEEVGVLFASMPNFSDFYTEESVNNQGLECLRFLNEVISDYDALLDKIRYKGISKIKTIASSYMAASGLTVTESLKGQSDRVRWEHLAILVEFALELRDTLNNINAESFNHFILQMGVNHGPVTAGVIGARKPHYDIWGNTVNVASRMESTGQAGYIQCTAETKEVLELFGYEFEQRGIINIKGKGQLLTYFLIGRKSQDSIKAEETHSVQEPNSLQT